MSFKAASIAGNISTRLKMAARYKEKGCSCVSVEREFCEM
jgi:hypothetical protein